MEGMVADFAKEGGIDRFRAKTGLPLSTYFSALKIRWILDNVRNARKLAEAGEILCGTVDTYLIWQLTGGVHQGLHLTDVTNASRTQLLNLASLQWDPEILAAFDIPANILPRIASSSELYGDSDTRFHRWREDCRSCLATSKRRSFGQTCFQPGEAKNTYGTGCFLLMNTGEQPFPSSCGLLTTVAYKLGSAKTVYALEGSVAITGALVQWVRDNLGLIQKSSDIEELARSVRDNGGVYFVPAFSGLYAPYWRSDARGVIAGLTRFANKGHLARAVLEATAYQTREVLEAMEKDSEIHLFSLRTDGGMVENDFLMQFQADILNIPVLRPAIKETTALGAAYAAGLAVGYYSDLHDLRENWSADRTWEPHMEEAQRDTYYRQWKKAVTRSFAWLD